MPRAARIVVPGLPHHVIQRGNRQQRIFFSDDDRRAYVEIIAHYCAKFGTSCLAWCLMENHVHLILTPSTEDGLRATVAAAHTVYAQRVNANQRVSGHLFQGRFKSYPMDLSHLMIAARYIENNPVKAGMVRKAEDWRWSSARAHVENWRDGLTDIDALKQNIGNWRAMLSDGLEAADADEAVASKALRTGLPQGDPQWIAALSDTLGRPLTRQKPGRKPI